MRQTEKQTKQHTHAFTVLTWYDLENTVAVDSLHDVVVVTFRMLDSEHTAVAALVSMGHVVQNNPEVLPCVSKSHPFWQGVVPTCNFKIAWASVTQTVLVAVGREEPVVP